ncbi:MAG: TonB-dependent receptor [Bacteroidia bacterium]|nr:TonB-dependent receptor [Bacteroidia bacterium]
MKQLRHNLKIKWTGSHSGKTIRIVKLLLILSMTIIFHFRTVESYSQTKEPISESGKSDNTSSLQQKSVSGTVTDKSGNLMPGVSVVVKGTVIGTATDANGNFSLELPAGAETLTFSLVGMVKQEVIIGNQTVFNIMLEESVQGLDEVVIVGYGVQKKVNLTGSVAAVKFDEAISSRPVVNFSTALEGLASGVSLRQSRGLPGYDDATIRIRGTGTLNNSAPMILLDGMEAYLWDINPRDVESVSILKDAASASIYGARAANGVILITTKNGAGKQLNVNYSGIFSISQPVNLLEFVSDYPTYMRLINESRRNIGSAEIFSSSTISKWEYANRYPDSLNAIGVPNYVAFPNTNWIKEMFHNSLAKDQTLSISGSTQSVKFLLSARYFDNPGVLDRTGMKTYSMRINLEADVNKWLKVGTRTAGNLYDYGNGTMDEYTRFFSYVKLTTPGVYPVYNGQYGYKEAPEESSTAGNGYCELYLTNGENKQYTANSLLFSKVTFLKGLSWDLNFNYFVSYIHMNNRTNPKIGERVKFSTGDVKSSETQPSQLKTYTYLYHWYTYTLENLLHYQATIAKKHNINTLLGYSESYLYNFQHDATKQGLFDESAWVFNAATSTVSINGSAFDYALRSWFGRLNYDFDGRYLLEANLRYDGSSRFYSDNRYGWFPSFSAGWRISQEKFLKNSKYVQNLKIRASWGKLGNNSSGNYDYQALYNPVYYSFNGSQVTGLRPSKIANPFLKWESTTVTNVGLDAALLKNRLLAEFDAYDKETDGILTTPPIYLTMGLVTAPTVNSAGVSNKGIEFTLGWKDQAGQVKYSVSVNFGYNKNEVTKYKGKLVAEWRTDTAGNKYYYSNIGNVSSGDAFRVLEGRSINEPYLLDVYTGNGTYFNADSTVNIAGGPRDGMIRTPEDMAWLNAMVAAGYQFMPGLGVAKNKIWYGDYIYADLNGDKIYGNNYDRRFTGTSAMPKITFGSQMSISWKNFDLNLTWYGQAVCKLYWLETCFNSSATGPRYQIGKMVADDHYYYNDANPSDSTNNINGSYPRLKYDANVNETQNSQPSTRWLFNGSFLRLKNLTLGYTIPKKIANKIFTEQIHLYISFENLFTITSFPGMDPEMGGNGNYVSYPIMKQIAFGINVTL